MSARLAKVILLTAFSLVVVAVVMQRQRLTNLYRFVVFDEPYINRTFNISRRIVSQTDAVFDQIARNADFDDRRGHIPAFDLPPSEQVSLTPTATGLVAYEGFLKQYSAIIGTVPGKYPTARETMNRIWNGGMKYTDDGIVWFDRKGPLTDIYYFSDDPATRAKLGKSIAP